MGKPATFHQRMALYNMHTALGKPVVGIRNMTAAEASKAIAAAQKEIDEKGFKKEENVCDCNSGRSTAK